MLLLWQAYIGQLISNFHLPQRNNLLVHAFISRLSSKTLTTMNFRCFTFGSIFIFKKFMGSLLGILPRSFYEFSSKIHSQKICDEFDCSYQQKKSFSAKKAVKKKWFTTKFGNFVIPNHQYFLFHILCTLLRNMYEWKTKKNLFAIPYWEHWFLLNFRIFHITRKIKNTIKGVYVDEWVINCQFFNAETMTHRFRVLVSKTYIPKNKFVRQFSEIVEINEFLYIHSWQCCYCQVRYERC